MVNVKYQKAYTEVLELLKYFPETEYAKIPSEKINFYKENMDKNYDFKIDPSIDLDKQNISIEANAVIVNLFMEYLATEEQKQKSKEIILANDAKEDNFKKELYNPNKIFSNNKSLKKESENENQEDKSNSMIEYKESFFEKLKKFIFRIFKIS